MEIKLFKRCVFEEKFIISTNFFFRKTNKLYSFFFLKSTFFLLSIRLSNIRISLIPLHTCFKYDIHSYSISFFIFNFRYSYKSI